MNLVSNLRSAEKRLDSLLINTPTSSEVARFRDVIIPDLTSQLTDVQRSEYTRLKAGKTPEQIRAEDAAAIKAMNENRDKPSI